MQHPNFFRRMVLIAISNTVLNSAACHGRERRSNRYLIPEGYVGWLRINYRIKEASPTPLEDGYNLFRFPDSGLMNTSSKGEEGFATDEYCYYLDSKRSAIPLSAINLLVWGGVAFGSKTVSGQEPSSYEEFFVGTREQYEQIGIKCKDSDLNPVIGPIEKCLRNIQGATPPKMQ